MRKVIIGIVGTVALLAAGIFAGDAEAARISGNFCCALGGHHICCNRTRGCPCGMPGPQCCKQYGTWHCPCPPKAP